MFNKNLFTVRNVLVIVVFSLAWHVIFSRVTAYLHKSETSDVTAAA